MTKELERRIIEEIVRMVPSEDDKRLIPFIASLPLSKTQEATLNFVMGGYKIAFYRYQDIITKEEFLEIWLYSRGEPIGYVRIDPQWENPDGDKKRRWELVRAYIRPKFRGRNLCRFFIKITFGLAKKNNAFSIVAYPRHVAMLVALIAEGFLAGTGDYDYTLRRIFREGRRWYRKDPGARRLYYAQEFRPFVQEESFIMERRIKKKGVWEFLGERI